MKKSVRVFVGAIPLAIALLTCGCAKPVGTNPAAASPQAKSTVDKVRDIASELLKIDVKTIKPSSSLEELGADDLDFVEIVMELEDTYSIVIPDDVLGAENTDRVQTAKKMTIQNLADIVDGLKKRPK